jgi:hypothetical protein
MITLDSKTYKVRSPNYSAGASKQVTVRMNLLGAMDVVHPPATQKIWHLKLKCPATGSAGTLTTLHASFAKTQNLSFTDEDSTAHSVVFTQMGDPVPAGPSRPFYLVDVELVKV